MNAKLKNLSYYITLAVIIIFTVAVCLLSIQREKGLSFKMVFYFVYANTTSDDYQKIENYSGADYCLFYNEQNYKVLSCYYVEADAKTVVAALQVQNFSCGILKIERGEYKIKFNVKKEEEDLFLNNLSELYSISQSVYEIANCTDNMPYLSETKVRLNKVLSRLFNLLNANVSNNFTQSITNFISQAENVLYGSPTPQKLRYLQSSIADFLINVQLL